MSTTETPETAERMSGADFAVRRQLLGLTNDEMAEILNVNPRTIRAWESERDPIPYRVPAELLLLCSEHASLADEMVAADDSFVLVRDRDEAAALGRPRGWYLAAGARAYVMDPTVLFDWRRDDEVVS